MDYKQIDSIAENLERKHMMNSSGESKEILAVTQAYLVLRIKTEPKPRFKRLKQMLFDAYCILDHPFTQIILLIAIIVFLAIHFTNGKL